MLLAASPLISVMIAGWIAETNGCTLHEGFVNPCVVNGTDIGQDLYAAFVLGWLMLATLPLGAIALLIWLAVLVFHLIIHARRKSNAPEPPMPQ